MTKAPMRSCQEVGSESVAARRWGPKTWDGVAESVGLGSQSKRTWLKQLRRAGVIYIQSYRKPPRGMSARVFALQVKPYERSDALPE